MIEHLNALIELISSQTLYNPNEEELKVVNLQAYLNGLKTLNSNVKDANTNWSNDRITRDDLLYGEKTGMLDTAFSVKGYIKSAFGATSPQFKQVGGLAFKRPHE